MEPRLSLLTLFSYLLTLNISGQNEVHFKKSPVTFEAAYVGDVVRNFSGGIKKGSSYLGLANLKIGFDTEEAHLWKGGQFFINAANAHGGNPSTSLIGDFHTVSNIEANEMTYIHELWYKQTIDHFEIIVGLQDLNSDFVSFDYGSLFINSTFGTPSTIADNVPSPIFPFTTAGVSLKWNINETNTLKVAVFDGLPTEYEHNQYNLNWSFKKDEGVFAVSEYQFTGLIKKHLKGSYRAGTYYHSQFMDPGIENIEDRVFRYNFGIYLIADQVIYQKPGGKGSLGIFGQLAISPKSINTHYRYLGFGLSWQGVLKDRDEDKLGIAITNAGFYDSAKRSETIFEVYYKTQLTENIFVQPDFQYVINPGLTDMNLNNASVGFIRFGFNF